MCEPGAGWLRPRVRTDRRTPASPPVPTPRHAGPAQACPEHAMSPRRPGRPRTGDGVRRALRSFARSRPWRRSPAQERPACARRRGRGRDSAVPGGRTGHAPPWAGHHFIKGGLQIHQGGACRDTRFVRICCRAVGRSGFGGRVSTGRVVCPSPRPWLGGACRLVWRVWSGWVRRNRPVRLVSVPTGPYTFAWRGAFRRGGWQRWLGVYPEEHWS